MSVLSQQQQQLQLQQQQYCLRWNNHRTNLLACFEDLLHNEDFTDVTLVCDGGAPVKCHRMVLAACSPYFQHLFTDLPCKHPVVVLKDVKYAEIKAILEYMYKGEVNVAQDQLAALLKVAEDLKVKGLVEETRANNNSNSNTSGGSGDGSPASSTPRHHHHDQDRLSSHSPLGAVSTSTAGHNAVHSSSSGAGSPPPAQHATSAIYKNPYSMYGSKTQEHNRIPNVPLWAVPGLPLPPHPSVPGTSPHHPTASVMYDPSDSPLKRKKLSGLLMSRDTPILRTVLGAGQQEDTRGLHHPPQDRPVSLVCPPDSDGSGGEDRLKHMKNEPSEDAQSPYTDFTPMTDDEEKSKLAIPSSSPQSFGQEMRTGTGVNGGGIATYVPAQKPEWKRYKQYTRNDIMSAIEAVRNGMSALQAARKYGVPSRTLYDKVKKLGITTSRPFKRGTNGSSPCFPYASGSPYDGGLGDDGPVTPHHNNNNSSPAALALEGAAFLQHALDRGAVGAEERETLVAMAAAAAMHSMGRPPSSPSPTSMKYRPASLTPSPAPGSDHHNSHSETNGSSERDDHNDHDADADDEDQVEDLSINRSHKEESPARRIIMPPMSQVAAIIKKEHEMMMEGVQEQECRREVNVKD
ncbi:unnamed protein product [Acanthoscelides obtectus]|nr:unnamed protein product [Acanthoscelides obtectus]CAK1646706.1 Protein bric-a-brac 1 [Acanthoscelides obtectus]